MNDLKFFHIICCWRQFCSQSYNFLAIAFFLLDIKSYYVPIVYMCTRANTRVLTIWLGIMNNFVPFLQIAKISTQTAFISEFTQMVLIMAETENLKSKFGGKEVRICCLLPCFLWVSLLLHLVIVNFLSPCWLWEVE